MDELLDKIYHDMCIEIESKLGLSIDKLADEQKKREYEIKTNNKYIPTVYRNENSLAADIYQYFVVNTLIGIENFHDVGYLVDWLEKMASSKTMTRFDRCWEAEAFQTFIKRLIQDLRLDEKGLEITKQKILDSKTDYWTEKSFQADVISVMRDLSIPNVGKGRRTTREASDLKQKRVWLAVNLYMKREDLSSTKTNAYEEVNEKFGWSDAQRIYPKMEKTRWSKREGLLELNFYLHKKELPKWYRQREWRCLCHHTSGKCQCKK
ncbi:hypothetical protein [Vibrio nereis]|uniref:hypothetical protein n=1 Tax=Vibrio nereis TaxID=693 RepID=UPI00249590F8|nr:hypothetical protein [Vibrio nereis]